MIRLAQPLFGTDLLKDIDQIISSGQLIQGSRVEEFENKAAEVVGAEYAVAVTNGTLALELALQALGIGLGSRVGVPAYSFVASASAVHRVGATPVFVDVRATDLTMDVDQILPLLDRNELDGVLPVDEFGFPSDVAALRISGNTTLVVEDAACAFGTESSPRIGDLADAWCYSFHPRKVLTAGEGGLICTNNEGVAETLRLYRSHGIRKLHGELDCGLAGTNARMTEIQAVLALDQLRSLGERLTRRRAIAEIYLDQLRSSALRLPSDSPHVNPNWQTFLVRFPSAAARGAAMRRFADAGIEVSVGAQCIPAMTWYRSQEGASNPAESFPNAWDAWMTGLAIPLHEGMSDGNVEHVLSVLLAREVTA